VLEELDQRGEKRFVLGFCGRGYKHPVVVSRVLRRVRRMYQLTIVDICHLDRASIKESLNVRKKRGNGSREVIGELH